MQEQEKKAHRYICMLMWAVVVLMIVLVFQHPKIEKLQTENAELRAELALRPKPAEQEAKGKTLFVPRVWVDTDPKQPATEGEEWHLKANLLLQKLERLESGQIIQSKYSDVRPPPYWGYSHAFMNVARPLLEKKQYDAALEACAFMLGRYPQDVDWLELSGDIYAAQGEVWEAKARYEKAIAASGEGGALAKSHRDDIEKKIEKLFKK